MLRDRFKKAIFAKLFLNRRAIIAGINLILKYLQLKTIETPPKMPLFISTSKKKAAILITTCILYIGLGIWVASKCENHKPFRWVEITLLAGILLLVIATIFITTRSLKKNGGLTIDSTGITDNTNFGKSRRIEWRDVSDIRERHFVFKRSIGIFSKTAKDEIQVANFTDKTFAYDFEDLLKILLNAWKDSNQKH